MLPVSFNEELKDWLLDRIIDAMNYVSFNEELKEENPPSSILHVCVSFNEELKVEYLSLVGFIYPFVSFNEELKDVSFR